jgi:hypothetical protein
MARFLASPAAFVKLAPQAPLTRLSVIGAWTL